MLPEKIKLEILTPHSKVYCEEVSSVMLPGSEGYFGVYPGHTPFLATLKVGHITLKKDGNTDCFATNGGVAEVLPGEVSVLVETSENTKSIDQKRAQAAKERAENRIKEGRQKWDIRRAESALARAINRLQTAAR